jgi:hypothetical protein
MHCISAADWLIPLPVSLSSQPIIGIVLGVLAVVIVGISIFVMSVLYRRGLAIRRKRAMRRYLASGEVGRGERVCVSEREGERK